MGSTVGGQYLEDAQSTYVMAGFLAHSCEGLLYMGRRGDHSDPLAFYQYFLLVLLKYKLS